MPTDGAGTAIISTDVDVVNFVKLFSPPDEQQAVEVRWLGRTDVLQYMGETYLGIFTKLMHVKKKVYIMTALSSSIDPMACR